MPSLFKNKRFQDNAGWETTATDHAYLYFSGGMNVAINQILSLDPVIVYRAVPNSPNLFMGTMALNYKEIFSFGGVYEQTGELLSAGSYYYRIDLGDGSPIKDGWIYLSY